MALMRASNQQYAMRTGSSNGSNSPTANMLCRILGIDDQAQIAHVVDQGGGIREVSMTRSLGKPVSAPQTGEEWILTSVFGDWVFAVQINAQGRVGPSTSRPPTPNVGDSYFDTTLSKAVYWDGDSWNTWPDPYIPPTPPTPDVWHQVGTANNPAFQNAWVQYPDANFGKVRFVKDSGGWVNVEGLMSSGAGNTTAFTLPVGYRPNIRKIYYCAASTGLYRVDIFSNGAVTPQNGINGGTNGFVCFDGNVRFMAEN